MAFVLGTLNAHCARMYVLFAHNNDITACMAPNDSWISLKHTRTHAEAHRQQIKVSESWKF